MLHRIPLGIWDRFSRLSGWRKSAVINTILVSIVFLILTLSHVFLVARSGDPAGYHVIYSGGCADNKIGRLNTLLHLLINILSSLVLASSNFFMQVLNAPSREELDNAHEKGTSLDVGVSSPGNFFKVSLFKKTMWILFFLSSIPIHVLFNSSIFVTDNRGSEFSYFVFDESVLSGGAAFDPGTSLAVTALDDDNTDAGNYNFDTKSWKDWAHLDKAMQQYSKNIRLDKSRNIDTTVEEIQNGGWHKLSKSDCISLYNTSSCSGLQAYRNVAMILRGTTGWNRSQVWDLTTNESSFWDTYVPKDVNNSLWFSYPSNYSAISCSMKLIPEDVRDYVADAGSCWNSCSNLMALDYRLGKSDMWNYELFSSIPNSRQIELVSTLPMTEFRNSNLSVEYCLVEPSSTTCQIGLAATLLWVVSLWYIPYLIEWRQFGSHGSVVTNIYFSLSVLLKVVLCFVVITKLRKDTSLVTLGDVIESFISYPPGCSLVLGPKQCSPKRHRRWHAIPEKVWVSSHLIFLLGVGLLSYFFFSSYHITRWHGSFGQDAQKNQQVQLPYSFRPNFEQAILIANLPQLFLSISYLAFNGLFTRLHMAKEWSAMATRYKALRVTNPKGQQISTYFLQLPYRYSVPLLAISILLHWVLSGCIYILLTQGSYYPIDIGDFFSSDGASGPSGPSGPFDSSLVIGFSTKSIFAMMILSIFLTFIPLIVGLIRLPPKTIVVGSHSLAIAIACQVSPLVGQNQTQSSRSRRDSTDTPQEGEVELHHLMASSADVLLRDGEASKSQNGEEQRKATLLRVSQSKIKWGVVPMPPSWKDQFQMPGTTVEHLSFGVKEDDVQEPIVGHYYA